jgi:hypothetical protein
MQAELPPEFVAWLKTIKAKRARTVIEKSPVKDKQGRTIAAYRFGPPYQVQENKQGGRRAFSKTFKRRLIAAQGTQCAICSGRFEARLLQIDHRIPYEVAGDTSPHDTMSYMLVCGSCNRAKSWSCEHCENSINLKNPMLCQTCYWANPADHEHVALRKIRRVDIVWQEDEVEVYDQLKHYIQDAPESIRDYIKRLLVHHVSNLLDQTDPNME